MRDETATRCTIWKGLESSEGFEGRFGQFEEIRDFESTDGAEKRREENAKYFQPAFIR